MSELFIIVIVLGGSIGLIIVVVLGVKEDNKLKLMDRLISEFERKSFPSEKDKDINKQLLKKELIKIKDSMVINKNAIERARDKISLL